MNIQIVSKEQRQLISDIIQLYISEAVTTALTNPTHTSRQLHQVFASQAVGKILQILQIRDDNDE